MAPRNTIAFCALILSNLWEEEDEPWESEVAQQTFSSSILELSRELEKNVLGNRPSLLQAIRSMIQMDETITPERVAELLTIADKAFENLSVARRLEADARRDYERATEAYQGDDIPF
jgi:cytoplasmic iron level regulating protein YaaA (DUF328/UPF0246 family)